MNTKKGRILVVDDDRLVLAMVTHGLIQAGYEVIDADNGDEAILLAREHKPDLALLDIRMNGMSGLEVAQYLKEVGRTPFVFLSAFSDEATLAKVKELGALAYLVKPLEVGQIVPTIDAALARAQALANSTEASTSESSEHAEVMRAVVPLAVGVLMHRYSLSRGEALARLKRLAHQEGRSLQAQSERLVNAVEELAAQPAADA